MRLSSTRLSSMRPSSTRREVRPRWAGPHLVICNWRDSAHPRAGGAEQYCEEVARQLCRQGASVTLLTSRPPGVPAREETDWGAIVRVGGTFTTYPRGLAWLARHRRSIDGIIDSENGIPYFAPVAVRRDTPVVLLMHHVHQQQFGLYYPRPAAAVGRLLERYGIRWVYRGRPAAAVSPSTRVEMRRQLGFRGPVHLAPNGLSVPVDGPAADRSSAPTIVCVGRLVPHKRYELLVEATGRLVERWPDLRVEIIGDGPARPGLAELTRRQGLDQRITLHGRLGGAERDRLLASAWLTVNPTVGEGWGLSVLEAAALGVPAVAFDVPGVQDSIRHGHTGWLAAEGGALADVVDHALTVLSDPEEAAAWSSRCREWAASFRWDVTASRLRAVLEAEAQRLAYVAGDRRSHSDVAAVVSLPEEDVDENLVSRLRRSDQLRVRSGTVELLLWGADEHDSRACLERVGVSHPHLAPVRLARRSDQFGWVTPDAWDTTPPAARDERSHHSPLEQEIDRQARRRAIGRVDIRRR